VANTGIHARSHRCNAPDGIPVLVHVKIFSDTASATAGNDARRFVVTDDLGGTYLRSVNITVTEPGSSSTGVQVHNLTNTDDVLTTITTIDTGDTNSYDSASPHEVDLTVNRCLRGDVLRVDVDDGSDALGLEVLLEFGPQLVKLT
jgi:hypothetical protein